MSFLERLRKSRHRETRRMARPGGEPVPEWFDVGQLGARATSIAKLYERAEAILQEKRREGFVPLTIIEPASGYFGDAQGVRQEVLQRLRDSMRDQAGLVITPDPEHPVKESTMPGLSGRAKHAIAIGDVFVVEGQASDGRRNVAVVVMTGS